MIHNLNNEPHQPADNARPVETGNASNPSPHKNAEPLVTEQIISLQGEKYLREAGNIEDEPDAQDQEEMDKTIKEKGRSK